MKTLSAKKACQQFLQLVSPDELLRQVKELWEREKGQTFKDYHAAADYTFALMKQAGLKNLERIAFPANGQTAYQDKVSPLAWQASVGRLEIISSPVPFPEPVVADYHRHPFHLIKGSTATPPSGRYVRLVTQEQAFSGQDLNNCLVILEPDCRPIAPLTGKLLDLGAAGWVNTYVLDRYLTPDGIGWVNACTEGNHWHVRRDDRPFLGFSVSPRTGDLLRSAARQGTVLARAVCDGKRFSGKVDLLTGILPGQDARELWLLAHLYEPMPDDNAAGVIAAIAMVKSLTTMLKQGLVKPLRFTLRLVFGLEVYGFAAFAERQGGYLGEKTVGAMNLDGFPCQANLPVNIWLAPPAAPFCGNALMEQMVAQLPCLPLPLVRPFLKKTGKGSYADDMFLNDATVKLRTIWPLTEHRLHHNSCQTMSLFHAETYRQYLAFLGTYVTRLLTLDPDSAAALLRQAIHTAWEKIEKLTSEKTCCPEYLKWAITVELETLTDFLRLFPESRLESLLKDFSAETERILARYQAWFLRTKTTLPEPISPLRQQAATVIPARASRGFPFDLASVPKEERRLLPDCVIYGPLARILSHMDGRKNLARLFQIVEWETERTLPDKEVRSFLSAIDYLTRYGYLKTTYQKTLTRDDVVRALLVAGIRPGDLVLVHSSLSAFGHLQDGADTVIDAFLEAVGTSGTVLFPTFTYPYLYFNGEVITGQRYSPFHAGDTGVWTGAVSIAALKRKEIIRSAHPTHSVAGFGPLARECLASHQETDPPAGPTSIFPKLVSCNGKMVWFGADLASTTFFHYLETEANLPYLQPAVCRIIRENGHADVVLIPQHLPGHRDFYRVPGERSKAYQRLILAGLLIKKVKLGSGEIKVIQARQMYRLGKKILRQDAGVFLCDEPECLFCQQYGYLKGKKLTV